MKPRSFSRLSARQIKHLCALANQAFKIAKTRGALDDDMKADDYRKQGQMEAAKIESLKDAGQHHYLPILGKWFTVIGRLDEAFYAFLNEGPDNEARHQKGWLLAGHVAHLAEAIGNRHHRETAITLDQAETARQAWAYTNSISKDKFNGRPMASLDAEELEQLMYTVINRTNAKRGVGDSTTRNKSQRRPHRSDPAEDAPEIPRESNNGPGLITRARERLSAAWPN